MRTSIIKRLALALLLPALGISAFTGTVAAETGPVPHENPAGAAIRLDIAIALLHYSQIFEQVADRNYSEARALIEQIKPGQAHLPADIAFIMTRYNDLTTDLTERLDELDSTLDSCEQLLSQNRLDEAAVKLSQAGALANETAALMDGIGSATEELLLKIAPFISPGKAQEISNAQARLQEAMERLKELEAWCRDLLQHLQAVAEEKVKLSVSGLSLNTAPRELWLGEHVTLSGTLKAGDVPLPSRNVSILLEGGFFTSATTTADGTYETSFALPFRYT
ncbi:MAG: hypothetical protein U9Q17_01800, partial [Chloroflexota bacterium]|nr:hypothetical protein [Chloroflexota bacterium]